MAANNKNYYHEEDEEEDIFYTIQEEEDEEDSFEREKRIKRERMQTEYEQKIDELEKIFGGSFLNSVPGKEN